MIASYLVPPVYRMVGDLNDSIHWEGLCLNPHPGMVPLVDAYFERCLSIQSYLDWTMLLHLNSNPASCPLVEKYGYYFLILLNSRYSFPHHIPPIYPSAHLIESIECGTIRRNELDPHSAEMVYQYPGIFQLDRVKTRDVLDNIVHQFSHKKLKE